MKSATDFDKTFLSHIVESCRHHNTICREKKALIYAWLAFAGSHLETFAGYVTNSVKNFIGINVTNSEYMLLIRKKILLF